MPASLTSNSWGISRRARYSLASLVFISSRISSEITTCPERVLLFLQRSQRRKVIFGERPSSRRRPLSAFSPRVWTFQLDSCRRCHLSAADGDADAWSVSLPSYRAPRPARAMCALTWARRLRAVPRDARASSARRFPPACSQPGNLVVIFHW